MTDTPRRVTITACQRGWVRLELTVGPDQVSFNLSHGTITVDALLSPEEAEALRQDTDAEMRRRAVIERADWVMEGKPLQ